MTVGIAATALLAAILYLALVTAGPVPPAAAAGFFTVDDIGDDGDAALGDGVCATAGGACTLRAAVEESNALNGADTISFAIPGTGPHVIDIADTLVIEDHSGGTTIDGYSQPGASTNTSIDGFDAVIQVHLTTDDTPNPMVLIRSAENTLTGLSIYGNGPRVELRSENANGNTLSGNIIGTDPTGTYESSAPGLDGSVNAGIQMNLGPSQNIIGGATPADRNVISGNDLFGIRVNHGETSQNVVENNIIGLKPDLTDTLTQTVGIDLQWYTWGNYVVDNLLSGQGGQAVDLSHSSAGNVIIDNYIGTYADGDSSDFRSRNGRGVTVKDNATNNWVVDNVIAGNRRDGIWHKHNYTGFNYFIENRIGVGVDGAALGNTEYGLSLTGHDDLYLRNIFANNTLTAISVSNYLGTGPNFDPEQTLGNSFLENTFYNAATPYIDFVLDTGETPADGPHGLIEPPVVTGIGPGEVYGTACADCTIEVYVSGVVAPDGTLDTTTADVGDGAGWIGRVNAAADGTWSLGHADIQIGKLLTGTATESDGTTSELATATTVPATPTGTGTNPDPSLGQTTAPTTPARPPAYTPDAFTCSWTAGTLTWDDEAAATYYVRTIDANGADTYLGAFSGTSTTVPDATSYRVIHWAQGFSRTADCNGPGDPAPPDPFACTYDTGVLSWTDEGASTYYVRTVDANGVDSYYGSTSATTLTVPAATGYQVIHWLGGQHTTTCAGPGEAPAFTCAYDTGVLSWTDEGASTYFVRTVDANGVDTYYGSTSATTLTVPDAADYQVIHWLGGQHTTTCAGPGEAAPPAPFACTHDTGVLSWTDEGASAYYVRTVDANGVDTYYGSTSATSLTVPDAASYQVIHWLGGQQLATCVGPGDPAPPTPFTCTYDNGVLSWTDEGAGVYYIRTVDANGVDTFYSSTSATSLTVPAATGYQVIHWVGGKNTAIC